MKTYMLVNKITNTLYMHVNKMVYQVIFHSIFMLQYIIIFIYCEIVYHAITYIMLIVASLRYA